MSAASKDHDHDHEAGSGCCEGMAAGHGNGVIGETKRDRKNLKIVDQACGRAKMHECQFGNWSSEEEFEAHRKMHVTASVIEAKFAPDWKQTLNEINELNQGAMKAKEPEEAHLLALEAETTASTLLVEVKQTCVQFGMEYDVTADSLPCYAKSVLCYLPRMYLERAVAHKLQGKLVNAIVDATIGLDWSRHIKCKDPRAKPPVVDVNLLFTRGDAFHEMGDLDGAMQDCRAVCLAIRLHGDEGWHMAGGCCNGPYHLNLETAVKALLIVMAKQKMQQNAPRPHYPVDEKNKISKQLGIGIYGKKALLCANCGASPSDHVHLTLCGGCRMMWLCGKECHKEFWRAGHKLSCNGRVPFDALVSPKMKARVDKDVANQGYAVVYNMWGPLVFVCDISTGDLFDSLHDVNVVVAGEDGHSPNCPCCVNRDH